MTTAVLCTRPSAAFSTIDPARHHTERRAQSSRTRASWGPSSVPANSRLSAAGPTCSHISGRPTRRAPPSQARSSRERARGPLSLRSGPALIWMAAARNTLPPAAVISRNEPAAGLDLESSGLLGRQVTFSLCPPPAGARKVGAVCPLFLFLQDGVFTWVA